MNEQNTTKLGIKDVCEKFGLTPVYVRRMIQQGKIKTEKVEIGKNTFKHFINIEEIERWRASVSARSNREDGRSKFVLYASQEEMDKIQALLANEEIEAPIQRANKVKQVA